VYDIFQYHYAVCDMLKKPEGDDENGNYTEVVLRVVMQVA
jgi:hypothetical protein